MELEENLLTDEEIKVVKFSRIRFIEWVLDFVNENKDDLPAIEEELDHIAVVRKWLWQHGAWAAMLYLPLSKDEDVFRIISNTPSFKDWYEILAALIVSYDSVDYAKEVKAHYRLGDAYYYDGNSSFFYERGLDRLEEAIKEYNQALAIDPLNVEVRYFLACLYSNTDRHLEALIECIRILRSAPVHSEFFLEKIDLSYHIRCLSGYGARETLRLLEYIIQSNPQNTPARKELARLCFLDLKLRESLFAVKKKFILENPYIVRSLIGFAILFLEHAHYSEAKPFLDRVIKIYQERLSSDYSKDTLDQNDTLNLNNALNLRALALLLYKEAEYTDAELSIRLSLEIYERELQDHHDLATTLYDLALILTAQGRDIEAQSVVDKTLGIYEKLLDIERPEFALSLRSPFAEKIRQCNYTEAVALMSKSLEYKIDRVGADNCDVALSMNDLASLFYKQNQFEQSAELLRLAIEILNRQLGPNHPKTRVLKNNQMLIANRIKSIAGQSNLT